MRALLAVAATGAALLAGAGCKSSTPGSVDLTIVADASLPDSTVAAIGVLEISVSGAANITEPYLVSHPFSTGRQERLVVRPPVSAGSLTIAVLAHGTGGVAVGYGQTDVTLRSSGSVVATVTLTADVPGSDGGGPADMAVSSGPSLQLIAGHVGGMGYADGTSSVARFNNPRGIVIVGGNGYVADMNNHVIRKIALASGAVTTLAGTPLRAGGSDGTGAAARFNRPTALASDGTNLYVSDMRNQTIRQIVIASGAVTTLAGTAGAAGSTDNSGAAARFDHPHGLVCDGAGNLYVADNNNHTIRKIVIAGGVVTTFAGTAGMRAFADGTGAAARFNSPHGLAFDNGNLFVADTGNHAIRQIDAGGVVTTPAGQGGAAGMVDATGGAARFNAPRGLASDGAGSLWVADSGNSRVRKLVEASGVVTTLAGHDTFGSVDGTGAGAGFAGPFSIAVDGSGNLFVTESFAHTVRQVTTSGVTTTFAGVTSADGIADGIGAAALFRRPHALCLDGSALYVTDKQNHAVRKVDPSSGSVATIAGGSQPGSNDGVGALASFNGPFGCVADGAGKLYVSDGNNDTIRAINLATGAVSTIAGSAGKTGTLDATGAAARFNNPAALAIGGGILYVADLGNHTVRAIVLASAAVTTLAGTGGASGSMDATGTAARFNHPNGLALDGGNLYVADQNNSTIRRIVLGSGVVTTLAGTAGMVGAADGTGSAARFFNPHALAADGSGNLYVADTLNHTVRKIALASGAVSTVAGVAGLASVKLGPLPGILNTPTGLAVGSGGALFISTAHENALVVVR
jgi:sugar lactone lactonase YvrE